MNVKTQAESTLTPFKPITGCWFPPYLKRTPHKPLARYYRYITFLFSQVFQSADQAPFFWLAPNRVLKNMVSSGISGGIEKQVDGAITAACEFMTERLETLDRPVLASRWLKKNLYSKFNFVEIYLFENSEKIAQFRV